MSIQTPHAKTRATENIRSIVIDKDVLWLVVSGAPLPLHYFSLHHALLLLALLIHHLQFQFPMEIIFHHLL
jgi:hypothetical protein